MKAITILEYSNLKNTTQYDVVLKHLNPINQFSDKNINLDQLSYADFRKALKLLPNANNFEVALNLFKMVFKFENDIDFWNENIEVFFSAQNYIVKLFSDKIKTENNLLKSIDIDTILWEQAGGNSLKPFSDLLPIVQLAEIYHLYPYDLINKPYNEIIVLLVLHKRKSEVQNKYNELKYKNNG
jgi:hypothetical protein